MFGMGFGELIVVLVIVLLVFGPGRLPEMMGHLGKGVQEFKKGLQDVPERDAPPQNQTPPREVKREG
jgi:sec-independent protein translocase protein TatA